MQGSIFFPLPDGTGLLYNLTGTADAPRAVAKIMREVPCKTSYTELLTVSNWLKKAQRFRVHFDPMKPEKPDPATKIGHLDYIDVPANSSRDFKVTFYAHREGMFIFKVRATGVRPLPPLPTHTRTC